MLLLSACTTTVAVPERVQEENINGNHSEQGWYAVRFSIPRKKEAEPEWYVGTLIAGEIISPLLSKYPSKIICWRIHRRAVDDTVGHVFSFIFYGSQSDAAIIYQHVKSNKLLDQLNQQGILAKVTYDPLYNDRQTSLADTSDPAWPENIRSSWPFFMMGASHMWLEQIRGFKKETANQSDMQHRYQLIQKKLSKQWRQQGQHALLHHLNALYSYQPLSVRF